MNRSGKTGNGLVEFPVATALPDPTSDSGTTGSGRGRHTSAEMEAAVLRAQLELMKEQQKKFEAMLADQQRASTRARDTPSTPTSVVVNNTNSNTNNNSAPVPVVVSQAPRRRQVTCEQCGGSGQSTIGENMFAQTRAQSPDDECWTCNGTGRVLGDRQLTQQERARLGYFDT